MTIRTRMAPSPTGEFHIGGLRTLLYNYAFAKKSGGKFVLRIEDTDRARLVEGAVGRILEIIKDYGLGWDEGPDVGGDFAPYVQSERLDIYKKFALELVEKDLAYYCFCTPERLEALRKEQQDEGFPVTKYDRHCLNLSKEKIAEKLKNGESFVIRLKVPDNEIVEFDDLILGKIAIPSKDIDDQVLLKSDGYPTYHLAVVVDDHLMQISHILRGVEWLPSTPKHILLYKAFGWELPQFVHLPLLKEIDSSKKLSKRGGSVAALDFLKEGYLPEATLNFLMFLGWNPGTEKEIYSLEEFIQDFSIDRVQKTDLVVFDRPKLLWYNGYYIRSLTVDALWERLKAWSKKFDVALNGSKNGGGNHEAYIKSILSLVSDRMRLLADFNTLTHYFFVEPQIDQELLTQFVNNDAAKKDKILKGFAELLTKIDISNWNRENLDVLCHKFLTENDYKPKEAFMTLRVALTGETATPQIFDVMAVLGKEITLNRLEKQYSN